MNAEELVSYLDQYLRIGEIADYGPQGLQVEVEKGDISKIALAVDVSPAIIEAVGAWGGDMLLVHHGLFWGGEERIVGPFGERIRQLMKHKIHLYAAHLPLDAHPEVGNNARLAAMLGLKDVSWWAEVRGTPLAAMGECDPIHRDDVVQLLEDRLSTKGVLLPYGPETVSRVGVLSGSGVKFVPEAKGLGIDTFITGETSHSHYWLAADYRINVIFGGHYATETVGVKALGAHLTAKFGVESRFFDFPTGM